MEDRGGKHRRGMTIAYTGDHMIQIADPAGRDHRYRNAIGHGMGERNVKSLPCAVPVHGGEQDFAGPERNDLLRVFDGIDAGGIAAAMGEDLPALASRPAPDALGVDRHTTHLAPEFSRPL